ncbi:hypothetical protein RND81_08G213600 [Saponaria officinalis]|uniref:DUF674 family protein n=1 Tax=Saponaria officinalis TaxID=3572 RepID=A0AAW1JAB8_SAPOF
MSGNDVKLSLKLIIDTKAKKVVFAEAGKDFVDFVFHILSLPLGTVVNFMNNKGMNGCLGTVCKSFHLLDSEYFLRAFDRKTVFKPSIEAIVSRLFVGQNPLRDIYKCPSHSQFSFKPEQVCPESGCNMRMNRWCVFDKESILRFVKPTVVYMVKDDLEVQPMSISSIRNHVSDFDYVQEKVVEFGVKEALEILKASLETKAVLTTVF